MIKGIFLVLGLILLTFGNSYGILFLFPSLYLIYKKIFIKANNF